jgi:hypothetical protein
MKHIIAFFIIIFSQSCDQAGEPRDGECEDRWLAASGNVSICLASRVCRIDPMGGDCLATEVGGCGPCSELVCTELVTGACSVFDADECPAGWAEACGAL